MGWRDGASASSLPEQVVRLPSSAQGTVALAAGGACRHRTGSACHRAIVGTAAGKQGVRSGDTVAGGRQRWHMVSGAQKEVFLHVGLGKAASTYLQQKVFPRLRGVRYIPRRRYARAAEIIAAGPPGKYLVSREFGLEFERKVSEFAQRCPTASPIIVLRRHDEWIASQFRRYVKNGWHRSFEAFFDRERDVGLWKRSDLEFFAKLRLLEAQFGRPPLVLFHEVLRHEPLRFIDSLADHMGARWDQRRVSLDPVHRSYNDKQLRFMRSASRIIFRHRGVRAYQEETRVGRRARMLVCYAVLAVGRVVPAAWVSEEPLIRAETLAGIRDDYREDWQRCLDFAAASEAPRQRPGSAAAV